MRLARPFKSARASHASLTTETDMHAPYVIGACVCLCQRLARPLPIGSTVSHAPTDTQDGRPRMVGLMRARSGYQLGVDDRLLASSPVEGVRELTEPL